MAGGTMRPVKDENGYLIMQVRDYVIYVAQDRTSGMPFDVIEPDGTRRKMSALEFHMAQELGMVRGALWEPIKRLLPKELVTNELKAKFGVSAVNRSEEP